MNNTKNLLKKIEILERMIITDELTGLHNYRHFNNTLESEVLRAKRYERPLSMMVIDIDNFKEVNDKRGHHGGNLALKQIANILKFNLRSFNTIFRYGGDEFVIILPETSKKDTFKLAKRLNKLVKKELKVTISIGLAEFPKDGTTAETFFASADKSVYRAKSQKDTVDY